MNKENDTGLIPSNFIREIVKEDIASNKWKGRICTRFPPEPNGFLLQTSRSTDISNGITVCRIMCYFRFEFRNTNHGMTTSTFFSS